MKKFWCDLRCIVMDVLNGFSSISYDLSVIWIIGRFNLNQAFLSSDTMLLIILGTIVFFVLIKRKSALIEYSEECEALRRSVDIQGRAIIALTTELKRKSIPTIYPELRNDIRIYRLSLIDIAETITSLRVILFNVTSIDKTNMKYREILRHADELVIKFWIAYEHYMEIMDRVES